MHPHVRGFNGIRRNFAGAHVSGEGKTLAFRVSILSPEWTILNDRPGRCKIGLSSTSPFCIQRCIVNVSKHAFAVFP
jgi:hypothetical protein